MEKNKMLSKSLDVKKKSTEFRTSNKYLSSFADESMNSFLNSCRSEKKWSFYLEEKNVRLFKRETQGKYAEAKGVGILPYPPSACMKMVMRSAHVSLKEPNKYASKLDPDKLESYIINDFTNNGHLTLEYMRFRGFPLVVTSRDFVNVTQWRIMNDGSIFSCGSSAPQELQKKYCPSNSSYVRGDTIRGGWLFEPFGEGDRGSRVTLIICLDLKGLLPSWLIDQVTKTQPLCISTLKELLDQDVIDAGCRNKEEYIDRDLASILRN